MQPTLLELFAGGGLAGVGLRAAGFKPIGAVEYDADIAAVYAQNLGAHVQVASVCDVDYRPFAGVTLAHASPVCTRASVANANGGEEALDLAAADAVCRMLREARPLWFTMENVWGYREFESYRNIVRELLALGYQWRVEHINAANYGVAQTRKRLILRARLDGRNVGPLPQTHCQGGRDAGFLDDGLLPWVGWYAAIEDLLDTLPESKFADWQLRRLPAIITDAFLMGVNGEHGDAWRASTEPTPTIVADHSAGRLRAFLVESKNANQQYGDGLRGMDEPATTVIAFQSAAHRPKALLVDGDGNRSREPTVLEAADPSMTVQSWHGRRPVQMPRAMLVQESSSLDTRVADEPSATLVSSPRALHAKAWQETGRVVAMTPRALARFQSVPDGYVLPEKNSIACRIIGNAVPCLLAQRIGEYFLA